ncbi:HNH endonuclease signature motif containing protein [Microbacterium sp.]|uniref:HNH endonuclease n=1 Tax=Microbacterium sp. TaxID=51671 RepID=UPI0025D5F6D3|nr:HNH endonuclease signature motif containing protein [Microbacterium sp.]MBT9605750.1 HNH endonuclease [Microbacterium sp.]
MEPPFIIDVPQPRFFRDDHCANCLTELPIDIQGLYCSTWCQEVAAHVRYLRRVFRDGRFTDPDVQLAIHTKNAFLLVGGYRSLGRKLTPRLRAEVRVRDGGRCQQCGKAGAEVDHIQGNSDELENLQLLCLDCHHEKTAQNLVPASDNSKRLLKALMKTRVQPGDPQLLTDDEQEWNGIWRRLQSERKERFNERLRAADIRVRRDDSHAKKVLAFLEATAEVRPSPDLQPRSFNTDAFFENALRRAWHS